VGVGHPCPSMCVCVALVADTESESTGLDCRSAHRRNCDLCVHCIDYRDNVIAVVSQRNVNVDEREPECGCGVRARTALRLRGPSAFRP
jgi:hypothetical protein